MMGERTNAWLSGDRRFWGESLKYARQKIGELPLTPSVSYGKMSTQNSLQKNMQ